MNAFHKPATSTGIKWADLKACLLIIEPLSVEQGIKTVHGPSDAIKAHVTVIDGPDAGTVFSETLIFPKLLQAAVRGSIGSLVLGRLSQGVAKPGQSAPWVLEDATGSDADVALATPYLTANSATDEGAPF